MAENACTPEWISVATLNELWEGEMIAVQVGDESILLVHLPGGDIRAYQGYCPHQRTTLVDGNLEGRILTCAAHSWQFDLSTGQGVNPKSCQLDSYDVKIDDPAIFVRIRQSSTRGEEPWKRFGKNS
jgi:toluene monooxygenase system ferredoxin subunit